ncbi:hypothetical protein R6Q59_003246 [Mikania micrantha]
MAEDNEPLPIVNGVVSNFAIELKLLLPPLLFLSSLVALFRFFPSSARNLTACTSFPPPSSAVDLLTTTASPPPAANDKLQHTVVEGGVIKRNFNCYGSAAYSFILMSAYRGGGDTFAVIGLSSKPLHLFSNPTYLCQWIPHNTTEIHQNITVAGHKIFPDWGYGRVYTVVVVNCTFPFPVGHDGTGGRLLIHITATGSGDSNLNLTDTFEALTESPGSLNTSRFDSPPKYEYLYCGSPLYGNLSPQRIREWVAYHVNFFGRSSHFVLHDAGGVHREVMKVLRPWIEKGFVTLHDVKDEERFDGYYHNQFLIVNDCLHRYRFMTRWMFFFDVDEFIFVPNKTPIKTVTDSLSEFTQFTIQQRTMSNKLCYQDDNAGKAYTRQWGIEKLVYRDTKRGIRRDRKYAVQPRSVFATGVHLSRDLKGKTTHKTYEKMMYYHYHGTISERSEPCVRLVNTGLNLNGTPYVMDTSMREVARAVKIFELRSIGPVLQKTHQ